MIIEQLILLGFEFINGIVDALMIPTISIDLSALDTFLDVISNVAYFLPWTYLWPLFGFIIGLQGLRIAISLIKLITQIIPLW